VQGREKLHGFVSVHRSVLLNALEAGEPLADHRKLGARAAVVYLVETAG